MENTVKRRKYRKDNEIEALYKLYQNVPKEQDDETMTTRMMLST